MNIWLYVHVTKNSYRKKQFARNLPENKDFFNVWAYNDSKSGKRHAYRPSFLVTVRVTFAHTFLMINF
ncbi:hypothetical protein FC99_GL000066 [Levilactobacillus koreensis JCM 16448]|nr:hypothetical protein FC99_GL000066 [Levilactobacillus koreensis JCM 16448]